MGSWTLDDIPWQCFDRAKLDPDIIRIVKAASLVEHNGAAYAHHLCRIFSDDPEFQATARRWGEEEIQHGRALAGAPPLLGYALRCHRRPVYSSRSPPQAPRLR